LATNRAIGELVLSRNKWFKPEKRYQAVVIGFGLYQIAHVDTNVSEHKATLPECISSWDWLTPSNILPHCTDLHPIFVPLAILDRQALGQSLEAV